MLSFNLPLAVLAEWPGSFTCYCDNTRVEWIPKKEVGTEIWSRRIKFSRRSYRDSNLGPFDHESGALTTELSPLRILWPCLLPSDAALFVCDSAQSVHLSRAMQRTNRIWFCTICSSKATRLSITRIWFCTICSSKATRLSITHIWFCTISSHKTMRCSIIYIRICTICSW